MKQQVIVLVGLLLSLNLSAQTTYESKYNVKPMGGSLDLSKISFGLKISPTVSWVNVVNSDMQADGAALKFGIGALANYDLYSNLSLVSGINYNKFGGYVYDNKSLNEIDFETKFEVNYSEVEVPVTLKLKTSPVNKISYFLQGGFSAGFIVSASEKRIPIVDGAKPEYVDVSLMTRPTRLICILGAGIDHTLWKRTTLFGLITYKRTLTNVANSSVYQSSARYSPDVLIQPGSMEFSIGVMF
jgi:hypothetical protein